MTRQQIQTERMKDWKGLLKSGGRQNDRGLEKAEKENSSSSCLCGLSCCLGHSLIFALSSSMKRLLSSGEHPESILLNTLFNTFLFSCYTEVSSEWVLKRKNKTCGLVEFTMKPDSIAIEAIEGHHFLIFNISY